MEDLKELPFVGWGVAATPDGSGQEDQKVADLKQPPFIDWGVATTALDESGVSGDHYVVQSTPSGLLIAVVDGLGHGVEAARASHVAALTVKNYANDPMLQLVRRCHQSLKATRGVVMALALLDTAQKTMTWLGVGNVEGVLFREDDAGGIHTEHLLSRGGVLGRELPWLSASVVVLRRGDTICFATDGVEEVFHEAVRQPSEIGALLGQDCPAKETADLILTQYGKETDDALVLVARYLGGGP